MTKIRETWLTSEFYSSRYKDQLDQLQGRITILADELKHITTTKMTQVEQLETSVKVVKDSTKEITEIHQMMILYEKKTRDLDEKVRQNQETIEKAEKLLDELQGRESLVKTTLETLTKRRDKVKAIWNGIKTV